MESLKPVDLARMACAAVACVAGFVCLMTATAGTTPEGEAACVLDPTAFAVAVAAAVAYAWLTASGWRPRGPRRRGGPDRTGNRPPHEELRRGSPRRQDLCERDLRNGHLETHR